MPRRKLQVDPNQLPLPLFKRCRTCGQVIRQLPPSDPVSDALLDLLQAANGKYVSLRLIHDFIGIQIGRRTLQERLHALEVRKPSGLVARDPGHPKSGYKITYAGTLYLSDRTHQQEERAAAAA